MTCPACQFEAEYGSPENPHPVHRAAHSCVSDEEKAQLREKREEVALKFLEMVQYSAKLGALSDDEIATLVEEHVWAETTLLSAFSELLSQAIDRLRRANGGPMPLEELDS